MYARMITCARSYAHACSDAHAFTRVHAFTRMEIECLASKCLSRSAWRMNIAALLCEIGNE